MIQMLASCCTYYPFLVTDTLLPCHAMHVDVRRDEVRNSDQRVRMRGEEGGATGRGAGRGGGCNEWEGGVTAKERVATGSQVGYPKPQHVT